MNRNDSVFERDEEEPLGDAPPSLEPEEPEEQTVEGLSSEGRAPSPPSPYDPPLGVSRRGHLVHDVGITLLIAAETAKEHTPPSGMSNIMATLTLLVLHEAGMYVVSTVEHRTRLRVQTER
jgi:hypothetical protein